MNPSVPPPGFVARPPAPPREPEQLMTGTPCDRELLRESRRRLDSRRLGALLLDDLLVSVVLVPFWMHYGWNYGTLVFGAALAIAYHFVFDVTSGQTPGKRVTRLRVVMADGSPLSERAASGRSVLRIVDLTLAGLAVYMLSGGRRRRIGDYAAGTIVCDLARVGSYKRPLAGRDVAWPLAWLVPGVVVLAITATGHAPWSYRARADRVCAVANRYLERRGRGDFRDVLFAAATTEQVLGAMNPPPNWRERHRELLSRVRAQNALARTIDNEALNSYAVQRDMATQQAQAEADDVALAKLGYRDCAGAPA